MLVLQLGHPKESVDIWGLFGSLCIAAIAALNFLLRRSSGVTCEYRGSIFYVVMFGQILQGRSAGCCCSAPQTVATASASPALSGGSLARSCGDRRNPELSRG